MGQAVPRPGALTIDSFPYAVIDFETTGYSPERGDRVVEVAVIRMTSKGEVVNEYTTLVNPGRDTGPVFIHDIATKDVTEAPPFGEIIGDLIPLLRGSVLVAHNVKYDSAFLAAEFAIAGYPLPNIPTLCTLSLSYMLHTEALHHKLLDCCKCEGIPFEETHNALSDARATSQLLLAYFGVARKRRVVELRALACKNIGSPGRDWPDLGASGHVLPRSPMARPQPPDLPYLTRLIARLSGHGVANPDVGAYADLLDHVLQDRRVTANEAEGLLETAQRYGLNRAQALELHVNYLAQLIEVALADGVVSEAEQADLETVCALLGLTPSTLDAFLAEGRVQQNAPLIEEPGVSARSVGASPPKPAGGGSRRT